MIWFQPFKSGNLAVLETRSANYLIQSKIITILYYKFGFLKHYIPPFLQLHSSLTFSQLFILVLVALPCGVRATKTLLRLILVRVPPVFSSRNFMASGPTFKSLIHFELIFMYRERQWSIFTLLLVAVQFHTCRHGYHQKDQK